MPIEFPFGQFISVAPALHFLELLFQIEHNLRGDKDGFDGIPLFIPSNLCADCPVHIPIALGFEYSLFPDYPVVVFGLVFDGIGYSDIPSVHL